MPDADPDLDPSDLNPAVVGFIYVVVGSVLLLAGMALSELFPTFGRLVIAVGVLTILVAIAVSTIVWWRDRDV